MKGDDVARLNRVTQSIQNVAAVVRRGSHHLDMVHPTRYGFRTGVWSNCESSRGHRGTNRPRRLSKRVLSLYQPMHYSTINRGKHDQTMQNCGVLAIVGEQTPLCPTRETCKLHNSLHTHTVHTLQTNYRPATQRQPVLQAHLRLS